MRVQGVITILCVVLMCCNGCCPPWRECPEPSPEPDTMKLEDEDTALYRVVWQRPLFEDTLYSITFFKPILFEDIVIFSRRKGPYFHQEFVAFDKDSGRVVWEWQEEVRNLTFDTEPLVLTDTLVVASGSQIYLIDMRTGRTLVEINEEIDTNYVPIGGLLTYFGGRLYQTYEREFNDSLAYIRSVDLQTFRWRTEVIDYTTYPGDLIDVYSPSVWIMEGGDTIFVCLKRIINYKVPNRDRASLISYNVTADTVLWERDRIDATGALVELRIEGERIYFIGDRHVECVNKYTGATIWKTRASFDGGVLLASNPLYTDKRIVIGTTTGYITSIDKETGRRMYYRDINVNGFYLTLHEERLYTANVSLNVVDYWTGRLLLEIRKPPSYSRRTPGSWDNGVVIDSETDLLYVEDGFFAICMTLPRVE